MYPRTKTSSCGRTQHYPHAVWHRALKAHVSTDAIAYDVPTTTRPQVDADNGIHELRGGTHLLICPFQTQGQASRLGVQLWYPIYDRIEAVKDSEDVAWVGVVAASISFNGQLSADVGDTVGPIVATDNFSDILAPSAGTSFPYLQSTVDQAGAETGTAGMVHIKLNSLGARYVKFYFDEDGEDFRADSSDMNVLFTEI